MAKRINTVVVAWLAATAAQAQVPAKLPEICHATSPAEIEAMVHHKLSCGFDRAKMSFAGTPVEQARCLLRLATPEGLTPEKPLPERLDQLIGRATGIPASALDAYLKRIGVSPSFIGGGLTNSPSFTADGKAASYFVIHDTSTPNYLGKPFGPEIDSQSWSFNADLKRWQSGSKSVAHVFVARTGSSVTALDYSTPWRATRTETCVLGAASRGLFLHTELVQPRRSNPHGSPGNDGLAPSTPFKPFPPAQLDRLALAYVAASVRAGHWLIPAFHASIDETMPGGHDDPRDFDLADWAVRVGRVIDDIGKAG